MKSSFLKRLGSASLKFIYLSGIALVLSLLMMCTPKNPSLKLYVSTSGNDSWSGKLEQPDRDKTDGPFATLEGARNAIRELKETGKLPKGNVIVEIQGGIYEMPQVLELESRDGGSDSLSRIIYRTKKDSEVRLSGGKNLTKWELVKDQDVLGKLNPGARDKIYQADLKETGITDFGSPGGLGMELFFNDKPMWISRYPNKGFVKITGLFNEDPVDVRGTKGDKVGKFNYDDEHLSLWTDEKDAWVHGYWFWDWSEQRHKISKIDPAKKIIEVVPPYHHYGYRLGQWFYGFNLLSEINEPGEYYIDREKGLIYFYPPSEIHTARTYVSLNRNIISMKNVSFLTIQGMILEGCRETVVNMQDCNNSIVRGCTIRNAGDWAVIIKGGTYNGVTDCDIYDTGAGGVKIDAGDRKTLVPGECFADNNHIHHIARIKRISNPCIWLFGVGNRATHNLMEHIPHNAIYFNGNEHLMEYNEISDACYESNDAGAIYAGRDWAMRGTIIRYNYLHDISGFEGQGCVGIYLDDAFSSAEVTGNVFYRVTRAMMLGGGRDNTIVNNIFVDCVPSLHIDARGMNWMAYHIDDWIKEANEKGTVLGIDYNHPPYSTRYPKLMDIFKDEPYSPKGNVISRNVCLRGDWDKPAGFWPVSIEPIARPYLKMEDNVVSPATEVLDSLSKSFIIADPLFVNTQNPEQGKFQLSADSPALKLGFEQIPFNKIGLYKSEYRLK
ncbi:MAG: right-handed parallel beta-helix repeat-containing protein [Bacteroidota bacterium]